MMLNRWVWLQLKASSSYAVGMVPASEERPRGGYISVDNRYLPFVAPVSNFEAGRSKDALVPAIPGVVACSLSLFSLALCLSQTPDDSRNMSSTIAQAFPCGGADGHGHAPHKAPRVCWVLARWPRLSQWSNLSDLVTAGFE